MKRITITAKQAQQFNKMKQALTVISKSFQPPTQLRKESGNDYGLEYEEALEMSYENIQGIAKAGVKNVRPLSFN